MTSGPPRPLHGPAGSTPSVDAAGLTSDPDPSATAPLDDRPMDGALPSGLASGVTFGRYTLLAELGQGGMGTVFKAWDPVLDRPVALKVLHAGRLAGERTTRRFLNEARAVARLDHPHIVEVHDMGLVDGAPYFTMALIDGPDLARWLRRREAPPEGRALCALLAPVARALAHAHRAGIIHRDVKPGNVIIGADGAARLVDFGVARLVDTDLTRTGQVIGTPAFMPPEQARGEADIDQRVDVFGLGAVIYWALKREMPQRDAPPTLPGRSRDLEAICHEALAPERDARYPDCDALAADLERFARGEPVQAARPGPARRLSWWLRRRRVAVFAVGGLALGLLGGQQIVQAVAARRAAAERAGVERAADERLSRVAEQIGALSTDGRTDEAERIRDAAVGRLDVQGTAALARFHLIEGERGLARHDPAAADAFAAAYVQSDVPELRRRALLGLGEHHRRGADRAELRAVLAAAERSLPGTLDDAAFVVLRRDMALLDRDLDAAAALSPPAAADVLRALSHHTRSSLPTERGSRTAELVTATVELSAELTQAMGLAPGRLVQIGFDLARPQPDLPPVARIPEPPGARWLRPPGVFVDPEDRTVLLGRVRSRAGDGVAMALYRWSQLDGPLIELWRDPRFTDWGPTHQVDLEGHGRAPIWFAPPWTLEALIPAGDDRWTQVTPDRRLARAGSIAYALRDVKTAAGPALAVALGEWRAYDLRLLRPDPGGPGLALSGRLKLGHLVGLAVDPSSAGESLWALTDGVNLNPRMFAVPPETPTIFRIRVDGPQPEVTASVPLPPHLHGVTRRLIPLTPSAGGPPTLAFYTHGKLWGTGLMVDPGGAEPAALALAGLQPLLALDLDGDGDDELVVRGRGEGPVMVLGTRSSDRLPPRPVDPAAGAAEGTGASDAMTWDAIEAMGASDDSAADGIEPGDDPIDDLVALGRLKTARDQLRLRAGTGRDPVRSRLRAGALSLRIDDPAGAASDFTEAAERASADTTARIAWRAAADAHRRLRQPAAERAALTAAGDSGPAADRAAVERRIAALTPQRTHRIDFTAPLAAGWRCVLPERLRRDGRRGRLRVEARMHDDHLATLSLKPTHDRVRIAGTLALDRAEQSSSLVLGLSRRRTGHPLDPAAASRPEAGWMLAHSGASGGGGLSVMAGSGDERRPLLRVPGAGPLDHGPVPFRIELDSAAGEAFVEWGEGPDARRRILRLAPIDGETASVALTLGTYRLPGGGDGALRATLGPIDVTGAELISPSGDPASEALAIDALRAALVDGRPDAVLAQAGAPALERAIALDAVDRLSEADAMLRAAPAGRRRDRLLIGWMHQRPGETLDRIERVWGADEALRLFLHAWSSTIDFHPEDAEVREALATIESRFDVQAIGADPDRRAVAAELLGRIARSAVALGRVRRARRALDGLLALMPSVVEPIVEDRIVGWMLMRAELEAQHGMLGASRLWLGRALDRSGVPELVTDHITASTLLAPLLPAGRGTDASPGGPAP